MSAGDLASQRALIDDFHYTIPLYRKAEAARIIRVPPSTLRGWAGGSTPAKEAGRRPKHPEIGSAEGGLTPPPIETLAEPLITTVDPRTPRGPSVPFVGLAEAYVLASFRGAGIPMQRIRPTIRRLEEQICLSQALNLASEG